MTGEPAHPVRYAAAPLFAAVAGAVDAIGFLHFHTFHVSFRSGNTTRAAVALAEGDLGLAMRGGGVIAHFLAGVVMGDIPTCESRRETW